MAGEGGLKDRHFIVNQLQNLGLVRVDHVASFAHMVVAEEHHSARLKLGWHTELAQVRLYGVSELREFALTKSHVFCGLKARASVLRHLRLSQCLLHCIE
eukprot:scaffold1612_cov137-Isochrysis_galbana.AAC.2